MLETLPEEIMEEVDKNVFEFTWEILKFDASTIVIQIEFSYPNMISID